MNWKQSVFVNALVVVGILLAIWPLATFVAICAILLLTGVWITLRDVYKFLGEQK